MAWASSVIDCVKAGAANAVTIPKIPADNKNFPFLNFLRFISICMTFSIKYNQINRKRKVGILTAPSCNQVTMYYTFTENNYSQEFAHVQKNEKKYLPGPARFHPG